CSSDLRWPLLQQRDRLGGEGRQITGAQSYRQHGFGKLQLLQPAAGDFEQLLGIALGTEQADGQTGRLAVTVLQGQLEALHAAVPAGQKGLQVQQQTAQRKQQGLVGVDLEVEFDAGNKLV